MTLLLALVEHIAFAAVLVAVYRRLVDSERREMILWEQIHRYELLVNPDRPFELPEELASALV